MERKIGEIFEHKGEWYQCVEGDCCKNCDLEENDECSNNECRSEKRKDNKPVIFKKLEKWGKPYPNADKLYQLYILPMNIEKLPTHTEGINLVRFDIVEIEIKQNKEDMEDLDKIKVRDSTKVEELNVMEEKKLNLKPFDIQKAREGKPVCTRDGRKARIICFDAKGDKPIIALIEYEIDERPCNYFANGRFYSNPNENNDADLMMLPEKRSGWVNVYRDCDGANITKDDNIYSSKDAAIASAQIIDGDNYIATTIIKWEE